MAFSLSELRKLKKSGEPFCRCKGLGTGHWSTEGTYEGNSFVLFTLFNILRSCSNKNVIMMQCFSGHPLVICYISCSNNRNLSSTMYWKIE